MNYIISISITTFGEISKGLLVISCIQFIIIYSTDIENEQLQSTDKPDKNIILQSCSEGMFSSLPNTKCLDCKILCMNSVLGL